MSEENNDLKQDMKKIKETVTGKKEGGSREGDRYYTYSDEEVELQEERSDEEAVDEEKEEEERAVKQDTGGYGGYEEESSEEVEQVEEEEEQEDSEVEEDKGYVETSSETDQEETDKGMMGEIPEPPTTKEIEVPEIEKGPLFIRVKKFRKAKEKVREMHEMGEDLKTQMTGLKSTLEEDKNINKNVYGVLRDLQESMNSIKDIVRPGKR